MPSFYPLLVAAPVLGLALYTGNHLFLVRFRPWRSPYPPLILAFLPGLLGVLALSLWALFEMQSGLLDLLGYSALNLVTYAALGWGYFHFVNMGIASLRIRMLRELQDAGGTLDRAHLLAGYNSASVVDLRIRRLTAGGHFVVVDERFYIGKRRFLITARIFDVLRRLLFGAHYLSVSTKSAAPSGADSAP